MNETMRRYVFAVLTGLLFFGCMVENSRAGALEQRLWQVRSLSDQGVLTLADGRQICLSGVRLIGSERQSAKSILSDLIDGRAVRLWHDKEPTYDRYGCLYAKIETDDGVLLQEALLQRGSAMVKPMPSLPTHSSTSSDEIDRWLVIEEEARQAGLGLWRDQRFRPKMASAMAEHIGTTSLVEGRVVRVSSNDRYAYLNFGRDWRTDFTVRIRNKLLKQDGIEPGDFDGKQLRVRGFVQEARGPLIDISHLKQIEVMP